jgi:hypothetical protein
MLKKIQARLDETMPPKAQGDPKKKKKLIFNPP